jgi:hypothetical protein
MCAASVFKVQYNFAQRVRDHGLLAIEAVMNRQVRDPLDIVGKEYGTWRPTPVIKDVFDRSLVGVIASRNYSCLDKSEKFHDLYEKFIYEDEGGFFATTGYDDIALLIPSEGILIVAPH